MPLDFLASRSEVDDASPADRAEWNARVNAWLFGADQLEEDDLVDARIHKANREWVQ